ncbi:unnamed protein product [Ambrosiozyma monospora]|uniref:Unnamed protein product n=1 Tax=Ambrosiozyma monospora TaxID=43982 RepID=A0ACB5UE77_AMBMO|nr:unnamed protein product [Ambrosiozyma monospora]
MGLSSEAANAIIYVTYGGMPICGIAVALYNTKIKDTGGKDFLCQNGTKGGVSLALNFIASGEYHFLELKTGYINFQIWKVVV